MTSTLLPGLIFTKENILEIHEDRLPPAKPLKETHLTADWSEVPILDDSNGVVKLDQRTSRVFDKGLASI